MHSPAFWRQAVLHGRQAALGCAPVLSILRHIIDAPFAFDTKDYAAKKKNLVGYMGRMKIASASDQRTART
jgi:hypothetical protein